MQWKTIKDYQYQPSRTYGCNDIMFIVTTPNNKMDETLKLLAKPCELILQPRKEKRSLTANSYMWLVCEKLARVEGITKEEVYRIAIHDVGVWDDIAVIPEGYESIKRNWERQGLGWIVEITGKYPKFWEVRLYTGSSVYDKRQMARLIDQLVYEAENHNLDVMTPKERSLLLDRWEKDKK